MALAEVIAGATLVNKLAQALKDKNLIEATDGTIPQIADIALGIGQLVEDDFFDFGGLNLEDDEISDQLISRLTDAVSTVQGLFPGKLEKTGKINQNLLNVLKRPTCKGCRESRLLLPMGRSAEAVAPSPISTKRPKLRVYIESLPDITSKDEAVERGWDIWAKHINLDIMETKNLAEANVVMKKFNLDGRGRNVGDADAGPPRDRLMEVRFDIAEDWTEDKFLYTCIHESGHILGMRHSSTPNEIMFKSFQPDYFNFHRDNENVLSEGDIDKIKDVWGPRKRGSASSFRPA